MNEHTHISDQLPLYVSGTLEDSLRLAVEQHLAACAACRADLALWRAVSVEIAVRNLDVIAPPGLADRALERARLPAGRSPGIASNLRRIAWLLRSQMPLVQREIWPASAAVIGLGFVAALIAGHAGFIYAIAPLVAAACLALIYGPENDPAYELALSTPASSRQILLTRLVLVFGYNLALALVATLGLLPAMPQPLLGDLLLAWLAPMTFLSAAGLVLSMWTGAPNAISITYTAWLAQLFTGFLRPSGTEIRFSATVLEIMAVYQGFWQSPGLLLALSVALFALAFWLAGWRSYGVRLPS